MATVTVACKIPNGLTVTWGEPGKDEQTVTFLGAAAPTAVGGFGLTPDVDADWFGAWFQWAQTHDLPFVKNGSIFANAREESVKKQAEERSGDVKTGLEGINGENTAADSRVPKDITKADKK